MNYAQRLVAACGGALLMLSGLTPPAYAVDETVTLDAAMAHGRTPEIKAASRLTYAKLKLMREDPTAMVGATGRVFYADEKPIIAAAEPAIPSNTTISTADAFTLHSRPGSKRTIYLDFTGDSVTDSWWSFEVPGASNPIVANPFDRDGDPTTFNSTERQLIIDVWSIVSEDYAPFNVDVTTAQPTYDQMERSSDADDTYGARALITDSNNQVSSWCGCGGVAYVGVFNGVSFFGGFDPAWVFSPNGYSASSTALIVSHEIGHTLGLWHDGLDTGSEYYNGKDHYNWGPIMGSPYGKQVTTWSNGDYAHANQFQNDVAVMDSYGASLMADDYGDTLAAAESVAAGSYSGLISARTDVDLFKFSAGSGSYSISATSPSVSPDLDIQLQLLNATGDVIDTADPAMSFASGKAGAAGMDATLTGTLTGGTYYVRVEGVGTSGATGYSDYGSLGRYNISLSFAPEPPKTAPTPPQNVSAVIGKRSAEVSWQPPLSDGGATIFSYTVTSTPDNKQCSTSTDLKCTVYGLSPTTAYSFTVTASNSAGTSDPSDATAPLTPDPDVPGKPTAVSAEPARSRALISWQAPVDDGGSAITSYTVTATPGGQQCTSETLACTVFGLSPVTTYTFTVIATNSVGNSADSDSSAPVLVPTNPPSAPRNVTLTISGATATLTWNEPVDFGGEAPSYTASSTVDGKQCVTSGELSCSVSALTRGLQYSFRVVATNSGGDSPASDASPFASASTRPTPPASVSVRSGKGTLTIEWSAPADDGGSAIAGYTVISTPAGHGCTSTDSLSCQATNLVFGQKYSFVVIARNQTSESDASSATDPVIALDAPSAPTYARATAGVESAKVTWTASGSNGGTAITSYTVVATPGGATCSTANSLYCTVYGLTAGARYTFQVFATNAMGDSPMSVPSAPSLVFGTPTAPSTVNVRIAVRSAVISWSGATSNGSAITLYTVTSDPGGKFCSTTGNSCTITDLDPLTLYTFSVSAKNAAGFSATAALSTPRVAVDVPYSPTGVSVVAGRERLIITWAPAQERGSATTGYTARVGDQGKTCYTLAATRCVVTGLTFGEVYKVTVFARSAVGNSEPSSPVNALVATAPDAAGITQLAASDRQLTISWAEPAANGSPIIGYTAVSLATGQQCQAPAGTTSCVISGLTNGKSYWVRVKATNAIGTSVSPVSPSAIPWGAPAAVDSLTSTGIAAGSSRIRWAPAYGNGRPVIRYEYSYKLETGSTWSNWTSTGLTLNTTLSGLSKGKNYQVRVRVTAGSMVESKVFTFTQTL